MTYENNDWEIIVDDMINRRKQLGITQKELEGLTGVKQSAIARIESKRVKPNLRTLIRLGLALGLELNLLGGNDMIENKEIKDFHEAWVFLENHPVFQDPKYKINSFRKCLSIDVVKVNRTNETIEDEDKLNTETRVWLECGYVTYEDKEINDSVPKILQRYYTHDIDLDCGGKTFEEAIIILANKVMLKHGTYTL